MAKTKNPESEIPTFDETKNDNKQANDIKNIIKTKKKTI